MGGDFGGSSDEFLSRQTPIPLFFEFQPSFNGAMPILGFCKQTDTAAALASGTPVTMSVPAYHSHVVVDVSGAVGAPFTMTLAGDSIDESTGVITPGDGENINVTGDGYYQSTKSWIDAVVIGIAEGAKSATIDVYRCTYYDRGNQDFTVSQLRVEWEPDQVSWDLEFELLKVEDDGSLTTIDSFDFDESDTPPRAASGEPGKYKKNLNTQVAAAGKEGIIIRIPLQAGIGSLFVGVAIHE